MSDPSEPLDHRTSPPATALGPDFDDEDEPATDTEEVVDGVEQVLAPGEDADDTEPPAGS